VDGRRAATSTRRAGARRSISGNGTYTWPRPRWRPTCRRGSNDRGTNFGWLVRGDESVAETAKRLASRENGDDLVAPALVVDYTAGGAGRPGRAACPRATARVLTATECASLGGTYQGNNAPCTPNPCSQSVTQRSPPRRQHALPDRRGHAEQRRRPDHAGVEELPADRCAGASFASTCAAIPAGSTIQSATLTLYNDQATNVGDVNAAIA
jgi:hypothetical protein